MTDNISLTGVVATVPRHLITSAGLAITSFRLASRQRRFDRAQSKWVDGDTNWYTVSTFRQLAYNAAASVSKGDGVVVTGRLRIRTWQAAEKSGTTIEIEADTVGHDLSWGTSKWARSAPAGAAEPDPEDPSELLAGAPTASPDSLVGAAPGWSSTWVSASPGVEAGASVGVGVGAGSESGALDDSTPF